MSPLLARAQAGAATAPHVTLRALGGGGAGEGLQATVTGCLEFPYRLARPGLHFEEVLLLLATLKRHFHLKDKKRILLEQLLGGHQYKTFQISILFYSNVSQIF